MLTREQLLAVCAYHRRADDLLRDGYQTIFAHVIDGLYLSKYRNRHGNTIILKLTLSDGILSQSRNGKEVFSCKMC